MKPRTISTLDGIYELDHDGFYVPYTEPEPKISGLWLIALGISAFAGFGVCSWLAYRAIEAGLGV